MVQKCAHTVDEVSDLHKGRLNAQPPLCKPALQSHGTVVIGYRGVGEFLHGPRVTRRSAEQVGQFRIVQGAVLILLAL